MKVAVAFVLLSMLGAAFSQQSFQAQISVADPTIVGTMKGTMDYDFPNKKQSIRYTLNGAPGPQEIILYDSELRYLICTGACDAETFQEAQAHFFKENGDTSTGTNIQLGSRNCAGWTKVSNSGPLRTIYIDSSNQICRADYTSGKVITFSNFAAVDSTQFTAFNGKGCPEQQCGKMIDLILVFDESGSIDASSFRYMKQFASSIADGYTFGPLNAAMGIVMFSSSARVVINLNSDKTSVTNAINSIQQQGGYTCLGCGISRGDQMFLDYGRTGAQRVMIFMTDGQNNRQTRDFPNTVQTAKDDDIIIFAIGVADADEDECKFISSSISGVTTYFYSPTYSQLGSILDQVIIVTCVDIPGNPCGTGCRGFCSCGKTCICPSDCNDNNMCTTDTCNPAVNGAGCTYPATPCTDGDACTQDNCDPATGCSFPPMVCTTTDKCKVPSCDSTIGCQYKTKNCDDGSPCTSDSCISSTGCHYVNVSCDLCLNPTPKHCDPIPCKNNECDPTDGQCKATNKTCNDGLVCSNDYCNPATDECQFDPVSCDDHDECTNDFCSETADASQGIVVGCNNIPVNVTSYCDDLTVCTNDTCDPASGCVNTPISCDDGHSCTVDTCNSVNGCEYTARDCTAELSVTLTGDCYVAACDETKGANPCFAKEFTGRTIDKCGVCDGDGKCGLDKKTVAGIAAGVLAAIIIGSIVVCAVLGAIGGKKGYDIYMRNKNNMTGANTNPLYHDNGLSGTNPMYTDEDSRL